MSSESFNQNLRRCGKMGVGIRVSDESLSLLATLDDMWKRCGGSVVLCIPRNLCTICWLTFLGEKTTEFKLS